MTKTVTKGKKPCLPAGRIFGQELILDLEDCDIGIISSKEKLQEYVFMLCDLIKMKRFGEPFIERFGLNADFTAGYSLVQLIETSSIVAHFSEHWRKAYLNIFSCKPFNANEAAEFTKNFFRAKRAKKKVLTR